MACVSNETTQQGTEHMTEPKRPGDWRRYLEVSSVARPEWAPIVRFNSSLLAGVAGKNRPDPMTAAEAETVRQYYEARGYSVRTPKGYEE